MKKPLIILLIVVGIVVIVGVVGATFVYFNNTNPQVEVKDGEITMNEDTTLNSNLQQFVSFPQNSGDTLRYVVDKMSTNTIKVDEFGNIEFTPPKDFNGIVSLKFHVEANDVNYPNIATININVKPVNDAPVGHSTSIVKVNENENVIIPYTDLASDVDSTNLKIEQPSAANGKVDVNSKNGDFTYTPNHNYNGVDTISYTINDGTTSTQAKVLIDVMAVNNPPVGHSPSIVKVNEDESVIIPVKDLASDIETSNLVISQINATNGKVEVNSTTGDFTYTPNTNYNGADTITYAISDGTTSIDSKVLIDVVPVNDLPIGYHIKPLTDTYDLKVTVNGQIDIPYTAAASDVDNDPITFSDIVGIDGTVKTNDNGFVFYPTIGFSGIAKMTYKVHAGNDVISSEIRFNVF